MILTNRLRLFSKKGYGLNPEPTSILSVDIVQPEESVGYGAVINAYTNPLGVISYVEILRGGKLYDQGTYLVFTDANTGRTWTTDASALTIDTTTGEITSYIIPVSQDNQGFSYPATSLFVNQFLEPVSTGLISSDHIFIVEEVFDEEGKTAYTYPRVEEYGPFKISEFSSNGTIASIKIETYPINGYVNFVELNKITGIDPSQLSTLQVGMYVTGTNTVIGTTIQEINTTYNYIVLSKNTLSPNTSLSLEAYVSHDLRQSNTIRIYGDPGSPLEGVHRITAVRPTTIYFELSQELPTTVSNSLYFGVIPVYRAYIGDNSDEEFFLFDISYNEDYPTITKRKEVFFEFNDATSPSVPDTLPTGNGVYQRTVYERIPKESLQINIGLQSDIEGSYVASIIIEDVTYPQAREIFNSIYECETIAEDERLGKLLENFGRDVTPVEELILRESDVYEDNVNFELLNAKRKEMLLEGDNIWPYVGSYKGLVNIINWFGYYDVRIKEYWLNVNQEDEYFGTYRQMQVPFQLRDKGKSSEAITLLPSLHYKKTSLFGLFYDIVRDSGDSDTFGVPETQDAFEYTNEEVLIKLFALKRYLKDKFLPLNARIVDITGEGVYYERYTINSWNDPSNMLEVNLTRQVDFKTNSKRISIVDARPFDADSTLISPPYFDLISNYNYKYDIISALISNPGGPYYGEIPSISFPGQAFQQARGIVRMRGYALGIIAPLTPSGTGYLPEDVITLGGGTYENPIRITVNAVGTNGEVTNFRIEAGPNQGSNYSALPGSFFQAAVLRPNGSQYVVANAEGFTCLSTDVPFEAESVFLYDKGLKYSTLPSATFTPAVGGISSSLNLKATSQTPVGYFNDKAIIEPYVDAPGIPVGAPLEVSTSFDITWNEVPYRWQDISGGEDATLKAYVNPLPTGTGQLLAVEIVNPGKGYKFTPNFKVAGGNGFGGTVGGSIKDGSLRILEYTVSAIGNSVGTGDILTLSPTIPAGGINAIGVGRIIKGKGIPEGTITSIVNPPFSEIYLTNFDGSPVATSIAVGDKILIHQGVYVINNGGGYSESPTVSPNGGQSGNLFTWDELGRGDFYQMSWRVTLTEPQDPTKQFNYTVGPKPIDDLITHNVLLPYVGKYTVELIVYDTDNNYTNEIKSDIEAVLPDANFSFTARYISDCADTWDEFAQTPLPEFEPTLGVLSPPPFEGIRYNWENAFGRWVNPTFSTAIWDDAKVTWDHINVGNSSVVNFYNFPPKNQIEILQVSSEDNLEGRVLGYTDSQTFPSSVNPTIRIENQRSYPEIQPSINPTDWIFIRRDEVIYQIEVISSDYSVPNITIIELATTPPEAFRNNPASWEILREIGGTVVLSGDQIYNENTNPNGIVIDKFIRLFGEDNIPKRKHIGIKGKDTYTGQPNSIILEGGGVDPIYTKGGELGQIYRFRGKDSANGNLIWNSVENTSVWVIEPSISVDPEINDHIGKLYIVDALSPEGCKPANPTNEIVPGFTVIKIYVTDSIGSLVYEQRLRTIHAYLDTGDTGHPYNIWNGALTSYGGVHVVDIATLDGGSLRDLNTYLANQFANGATVWIEYEYDVFPTRTYLGSNNSGDAEIYMDFNMYPATGEFINAPLGEFPASTVNDTGWYYDHGIASGDYSLQVLNTGYWKGGLGTIITLDDSQSELLRSSSSFLASQQNFDEDFAERKLGTLTTVWGNLRSLLWDETCFHTWDTLDYQNGLGCNFRIAAIDQNSSIQFNNDVPLYFQNVLGSMSPALQYANALHELRNTVSPGLSKFYYSVGSTSSPSSINYITGELDTYNYPSRILNVVDTTSISAGDIILGESLGIGKEVSSIVGSDLYLTTSIDKKLDFVADIQAGSYFLRNVTGLLESEIYVGEIITGSGLPIAPAQPAKVLEIIASGGQVRQIRLSQPSLTTEKMTAYSIEWYTPVNQGSSFMRLQSDGYFIIDAYAKTPSTDHLGWLVGQNGLQFYDWVSRQNVPLYHTYPIRNVYQRVGYGNGEVGGFQGGLEEFLLNERALQIYFYEGLNPIGGTKGWYPAADLPPAYSFLTNDPSPQPPAFDNVSEAEVLSNRLPYESAIGGSWRWEETYIGDLPAKIPSGTSILLSSDASKIAGKTSFLWKIIDESDQTLVEVIDPILLWRFDRGGKYTVELEVGDSNGNKNVYKKKDFFEIYES
jgi:hypothetical protein